MLVNLAEEPEYIEKLMCSKFWQVTLLRAHKKKKEDSICRHGRLASKLWKRHPERTTKRESFQSRPY